MDTTQASVSLGNMWGNINDKGAWNKPHRHNGCWLSGAFYVHADGDEGNFVAIKEGADTVSDFPHNNKQRESFEVSPVTGTLLLFPSGLIHMVEPNTTSKDRYSVAFNTVTHRMGGNTDIPIDYQWNRFDIDDPKVKG